jgi:hypothetical protein
MHLFDSEVDWIYLRDSASAMIRGSVVGQLIDISEVGCSAIGCDSTIREASIGFGSGRAEVSSGLVGRDRLWGT